MTTKRRGKAKIPRKSEIGPRSIAAVKSTHLTILVVQIDILRPHPVTERHTRVVVGVEVGQRNPIHANPVHRDRVPRYRPYITPPVIQRSPIASSSRVIGLAVELVVFVCADKQDFVAPTSGHGAPDRALVDHDGAVVVGWGRRWGGWRRRGRDWCRWRCWREVFGGRDRAQSSRITG